MPRPSRHGWASLCVLLGACSLLTDFDRDPIRGATSDEAGVEVRDAAVTMDARATPNRDASTTGEGDQEGGVEPGTDSGPNPNPVADAGRDADAGPAPGGDCRGHPDCPVSQLCCNGVCIATSDARCSDCAQGCTGSAANACRERACACGSAAACGGERPFCVSNAGTSSCAQCRDATDCAGRTDGRTECIAGSCAACDPSDNSGCSGSTPICSPSSLTCQACTMQPDNCPGALVCTAGGACGGCGANDAMDCTSATTPICNLAANPTVCRGCASDSECMTELSRPYCVANQRCSLCNPANDMGCNPGGNTPDCRLNAQGQYACQACNGSSCPSGTRCEPNSGRCVQCRTDGDCDPSSTAPFCDTVSGTCRACTAATALGSNIWCSLYTLLGRPVCHGSGRCVRCDGNLGCAAPTGRCYAPDAASPQSNVCVECRPGVAGDCSGATPFCGNNRRCRGCMTGASESMDCPASSGLPVCDPASGRCARCRLGGSGGNSGCPNNQTCVTGTSGPECGQCDDDGDCPAASPICNTATHNCRACTSADNGACAAKVTGSRCTARGRCERCDMSSHAPCGDGQLCCEGGGMASCVPTNNNRCTGCGVACPDGQMCVDGTRSCMATMMPDAGPL